MKINILIEKKSWAIDYLDKILFECKKIFKNSKIIYAAKNIRRNSDVTIIFSYFKIIDQELLSRSKYNIIPHESDLPKGRGMSPLTWQILEGKKKIFFSLIEASKKIDQGKIYYKKKVNVENSLLFKEIKILQLKKNLQLIIRFLKYLKIHKKSPKSFKQKSSASYYHIRKPEDSQLNVNKSIKSQFNLLRVADFKNYPNFFFYKKKKYLIKLIKDE